MRDEYRAPVQAGGFEEVVLPHLDAAYNLARWLVRKPQDAEEGGDARAWVLRIVRNTSYSFLEKNRPAELAEEFDEEVHQAVEEQPAAEAALLQSADRRMLREALDELPANFREVIVLRELEGMAYKEIAEVKGVPIGTVMSSLARARTQLRERLIRLRAKEEQGGLRK